MTPTATPDHALQRSTPAVTAPASDRRFAPAMQGPCHVDERRRAHPPGCLRQSICQHPPVLPPLRGAACGRLCRSAPFAPLGSTLAKRAGVRRRPTILH
jgi:hypothetical protein